MLLLRNCLLTDVSLAVVERLPLVIHWVAQVLVRSPPATISRARPGARYLLPRCVSALEWAWQPSSRVSSKVLGAQEFRVCQDGYLFLPWSDEHGRSLKVTVNALKTMEEDTLI